MSGHTGGVCLAHGRVWPCLQCAGHVRHRGEMTLAAPTVLYTFEQLRDRLKAEVDRSAGDWFFIDDLLHRAFPEALPPPDSVVSPTERSPAE